MEIVKILWKISKLDCILGDFVKTHNDHVEIGCFHVEIAKFIF